MARYQAWRKECVVPLPAAEGVVPGAIVSIRISDPDIVANLNAQGEGASLLFTLDDSLTKLPHATIRADVPKTISGAWTWFTRPESERIGLYEYWVPIDEFGGVRVCARKSTDNTYTETLLETLTGGTGSGINDHDNGSVLEVDGGKAGIFYSDHNGTVLKFRKQTTAGNPTAWDAAVVVTTNITAYACPIYINGLLYVFFRHNQSEQPRAYCVSADNGATWSAVINLFRAPSNASRTCLLARPYLHVIADATKIHFFLSDGQPNEVTDPVTGKYVNSMWHCYYDTATGNMHKSDGTVMAGGTFAAPPTGGFDVSLATLVFSGYAAQHPFWGWDIQLDASGHPCVFALEFVGAPDAYEEALVAFGRWTGSEWVTTTLSSVDGLDGYSTPVGPGGPEVWYHGGGVLDPANPSGRMLVSWPNAASADGWNIHELTSADEGVTWVNSRILNSTRSGERKCIRPVFPRGYVEADLLALWMEGHYRGFQASWTGSGSSWQSDRFATGIQTYPRIADAYAAEVTLDRDTSPQNIHMYWDNAGAPEQSQPDVVFAGWYEYSRDYHLNRWNTGRTVDLRGVTQFTVLATTYWDRTSYNAAQHTVISNWSGTTAGIMMREQAAGGNNIATIFNTTTAFPAANTAWSSSPAVQAWNVVAARWANSVSSGQLRPMLNGTALTAITGSASAMHGTISDNPIWVGWTPHTNGDNSFHGVIGFAGIASENLSDNWVKEFSKSNPFDPAWSYAPLGAVTTYEALGGGSSAETVVQILMLSEEE